MGGFAALSSTGGTSPGVLSGYGGSVSGTQNTQDFQGPLYARKSPQRKQQFLSDVVNTGGIGALQAGNTLLAQPIKYYSGILSDDRQKMLEAEAPEVNQIMSGYSAARRAGSEFTPRGGGRVQTLENQPYAEQAQVTNLLEKARPEAAQAVTKISEMLQNLGLGELNLGAQQLSSVMDYNLTQQATRDKLFASIGSSIGKILTGGLFSGGGGGSPADTGGGFGGGGDGGG